METALTVVQDNMKVKQKDTGGGPARGSGSRKFTAILLVICMIMMTIGSATCAAATYNTANATMVTFTDSEVTAQGSYSDYEIAGTEFTITGSGTYVFSGSCSDGNIVVKKGLTDVTVVFNGLKLTSTTTAPFNAKSDTEVTLVLADGTTNSLADTDRDAEKPKACLNSSGDLTITGGGSLTVSGNNKQGIKADGTLTVTGGKLTVSALKKALKADEKVVIGTEGGSDSDLSITVTSSYEGIESENIYFYSGTIDITSSDDGVNAVSSDDDETTTDTATTTAATTASTTSTTAADSSTSNGSASGPQAGGMPPGGFGNGGPGGFGGPGGESSGVGDYNIYIYGGDITVNASGDGLDSNGSIYMYGGNVTIWQTGNGDGALDYETACEVTGGTLLAAGSMGMVATPTKTDDSQAYINFSASSAISSGSTISVKDASGNTVYTKKAPKSVQSVVFSSPKLTDGSTYTLYEGSTQKASASATTANGNNGMGGGFGGGGMQRPDGTNGSMTPPSGTGTGSSGSSSSGSSSGSGSSSSDANQPPQLPDGGNGAQPGGFTDVAASSWYVQAVDYVTRSGLMSGTSTGVFSPDNAMTRAMLVTVLWRAEGQPTASTSASFKDVASNSWYSSAVAWAVENGIVNGTSATTFSPDKSITRQEIAAILQRYAKYKGVDVTQTADLSAYTDNASVASWASDAMAWAVNKGVITGATSTTLAPAANATRAQVATMLMRYMQQ